MFAYLVTPSGTKIAHEDRDLAQYVAVPSTALLPVLAALVAGRILRRDEGGRYEIFHDVLAAEVLDWRRLTPDGTRPRRERRLRDDVSGASGSSPRSRWWAWRSPQVLPSGRSRSAERTGAGGGRGVRGNHRRAQAAIAERRSDAQSSRNAAPIARARADVRPRRHGRPRNKPMRRRRRRRRTLRQRRTRSRRRSSRRRLRARA